MSTIMKWIIYIQYQANSHALLTWKWVGSHFLILVEGRMRAGWLEPQNLKLIGKRKKKIRSAKWKCRCFVTLSLSKMRPTMMRKGCDAHGAAPNLASTHFGKCGVESTSPCSTTVWSGREHERMLRWEISFCWLTKWCDRENGRWNC